MSIPLAEADLNPSQTNGWAKGKCFDSIGSSFSLTTSAMTAARERSAGQNYWYDLSKSMNCSDLYPFNVIYNGGQLNAFSFLINTPIQSTFAEHFTPTEAGVSIPLNFLHWLLSTRDSSSMKVNLKMKVKATAEPALRGANLFEVSAACN